MNDPLVDLRRLADPANLPIEAIIDADRASRLQQMLAALLRDNPDLLRRALKEAERMSSGYPPFVVIYCAQFMIEAARRSLEKLGGSRQDAHRVTDCLRDLMLATIQWEETRR